MQLDRQPFLMQGHPSTRFFTLLWYPGSNCIMPSKILQSQGRNGWAATKERSVIRTVLHMPVDDGVGLGRIEISVSGTCGI